MEKHTDSNTHLMIVIPERQAHWKLQEAERSNSLTELKTEPHDTIFIPDKKSKPSPKLYILLAGALSIFVILLWLFLPRWHKNTTVYDYKMLHITSEDFIGLECDNDFYEKDFYCHLENSNSSQNLPKCDSRSKNVTWDEILSITSHLKTREDALFVDDLIKMSWMSVGTLQGDHSVIAVENTDLDLRLFKMIKCVGKVQARVILVEGSLTKTIRSRSLSKPKTPGGKAAENREVQKDSEILRSDFSKINRPKELEDIEWVPCTLNDTVIYCKGIPSTFPYAEYKFYKGSSSDSQTGGSTCRMYDQISLKSVENILLTSGKMVKGIGENDNLLKKEIVKLIMGLFEMPLFKKEFAIVTNYEDKLYGQDESTKPELLTKFHFTTDSTASKTYQLRQSIRDLLGLDR